MTQATSPCVTESKAVASLKMVMQGLQNLYCLAGLCLPGKSIFARPKMIAPSWPKVVRPVAGGKVVASCGLSIDLLLASFFQN